MNLHSRIARLEGQPAAVAVTDAAIRATAEVWARAHDLDVDELIEEIRLVLAMTPAEREREMRERADELGELVDGMRAGTG